MLNIEHLGGDQLQKKLTWEQLGEFEEKTILEFSNGIMGAYISDFINILKPLL